MSQALRYENFIRSAFAIALNQDIGRGEDPGRLAEANYFNTSTLATKVKVGTSYAIEIYSSLLRNANSLSLSNDEDDRMDSIVEDVLNATTHEEINQLIKEYQDTFITPYTTYLA
jgi:hypothetical protein